MKTTPTELDREAAGLFKAAPGMRVLAFGRWVRVATDDYGLREMDEIATDAHSAEPPSALDTDDPATLGCMLAQAEEAMGHPVELQADVASATEWAFAVKTPSGKMVGARAGHAWWPTRAAALVSAMMSLKPG